MTTPTAERVRKHREGLRAAGLRPVQIWVPDTRSSRFAAECRRQAEAVARADAADREGAEQLDAALDDLPGWAA